MGYQGGSRRVSGEKFQKSAHEKAKSKRPKNKSGKYVEETPIPSSQEIAQKTLSSLSRLGTQTFALSPFSQYFDDWLVNLRQVIFEFESNPEIAVDEAFRKERAQIFVNVESELAQLRIKEAELETSAKSLADNNHLLVETDAQYASQTRELAAKRNSDIASLTKNVHDLEEELAKTEQLKTSFFGFTKRAKAKKEAEVTQRLNSAKGELEVVVQNFAAEQEKLHDEYEKKKQNLFEKVQSLEKEIINIETDGSTEARQAACNALANVVNGLFKRKPASST